MLTSSDISFYSWLFNLGLLSRFPPRVSLFWLLLFPEKHIPDILFSFPSHCTRCTSPVNMFACWDSSAAKQRIIPRTEIGWAAPSRIHGVPAEDLLNWVSIHSAWGFSFCIPYHFSSFFLKVLQAHSYCLGKSLFFFLLRLVLTF